MAGALTSSTYIGNVTGWPAEGAHPGMEIVRLVLDGAGIITTSATITLPARSSIKTITSIVGLGKCYLSPAVTLPVAASTGFTVDCTAVNNATAGQIVDLLIIGTA